MKRRSRALRDIGYYGSFLIMIPLFIGLIVWLYPLVQKQRAEWKLESLRTEKEIIEAKERNKYLEIDSSDNKAEKDNKESWIILSYRAIKESPVKCFLFVYISSLSICWILYWSQELYYYVRRRHFHIYIRSYEKIFYKPNIVKHFIYAFFLSLFSNILFSMNFVSLDDKIKDLIFIVLYLGHIGFSLRGGFD